MENNPIIKVAHISHTFSGEQGQETQALSDVSFKVARGTFTTLVGPSGCGKSTLLRIILGLTKATKGSLERNFAKAAFVFQNFAIFPWLTVHENVEFGLKMKGMNAKERKAAAQEKIEEVGLAGFQEQYPKELSGGMRQRVSIARALAVKPDLLLMDEPFSALDAITAAKLKNDILTLWNKYGMTILMVTHAISEAVELSDQIVVLSARPGHVKSCVSVPLERPRDTRSQDFFGLLDSIEAQIEE